MNEVFLIGKIHEIGEKNKNGHFILEVKRSFKNEHGDFLSDYFECKLWKGALDAMIASCKKGDIVSLKARLESQEDGKIIIIVEKLKFIYKENRYVKQ